MSTAVEATGEQPDSVAAVATQLETGERTVDTHVKTVRAKLRVVAPDADPIRTVRGLGYAVHVEG